MMPGRISLICITVVLFLGAAFYGFGYHITNYADQYFANTYNCSREIAMLNWEKAGQDDSRLIYAIRTCYMEPKSRLPYNLNDPNRQHYAQGGQDEFIDNVLNHKVKGFFVEGGAYDGEGLSNSLHFELHRHWTGLLIEPLSQQFNNLKLKHRKAFIINACLSKHPYPVQMQLRTQGYGSRVVDENKMSAKKGFESVQCFPFYSILLATGRTRVDFFSLDIEGDELTVLKTIPWNRVDIKVLIVEYNHIKEGRNALIGYMKGNGYTSLPELRRVGWQDLVFVKRGFTYNKDYIASLSNKHKLREK